MVDRATQYAKNVSAGRIVASKHVADACERHLRDLRDRKLRGLVWSLAKADRVFRFFETQLLLAGGSHEGRPFELLPWQAFVLGSIFGWQKKNEDTGEHVRRFRRAYIETGKGSGKTPLAAGIGMYMLLADGEQRPEIYAGAFAKDQAEILFRDALAMREQSAFLRSRLRIVGGSNPRAITYPRNSGIFRPMSTETKGRGKSGLRPSCVLLDELHEHQTDAMVEFLDAGAKNRRQPITIMITNSGSSREHFCYGWHRSSCSVAVGEIEDDSLFGLVYGLDEEDDPWTDEE